MSIYRNLSEIEIARLEKQNCRAEDWNKVLVDDKFDVSYVNSTRFSGKIKLGILEGEHILEGGLKIHSSITHATLHNCEIGDNVLINNVHNYIANYRIGNNVRIENIGSMYVEGESSFGNGIEISILNETGGREVIIYDTLNAHFAYMMAFNKDRRTFISKMKEMVYYYLENKTSNIGTVGDNACIVNTGTIKNVFIGNYTSIGGTTLLENGSINSNQYHPARIGSDVIATNFIISSGSQVYNAAKISHCFIGQGCHIGTNYSANNSLFFSNCHAENGEACSIFAGPYTVTHHKSTLLIGGMFSFMNAGSGTNQSNHMYKLGPMHIGLMERGCKTGSNSYLMWPAKIGVFSYIGGRHTKNTDTSKLPFSYLIEKNNESFLIPGINLKSVGIIRDAEKFPKRDNRKDINKLDQINFNLLNPYSVQKIFEAINVLNDLKEKYSDTSIYEYQGCRIKKSHLEKGLYYYHIAIKKFLGNALINKLHSCTCSSIEDIRNYLKPDSDIGKNNWCDLAGLIVPYSEVDKLIKCIENETICDLNEVNQVFSHLHNSYNAFAWTWCCNKIQEYFKISFASITVEDIIDIIYQWEIAISELDKLVYEDAKKEDALKSKINFELSEATCNSEQSRNSLDDDQFIKNIMKSTTDKKMLANSIIERLTKGIKI